MPQQTDKFHSTALETQSSGFGAISAFAAQDLAAIRAQLDGINASANNVSASLVKAFTNASASSRAFNSTLTTVAASLAQLAIGTGAGLLSQGLSSILGGLFGGGGGPMIAPFAEGGIVASPTFFGNGGSVGLMGERGAEAIVPLARGPNGQLGIAATGAPSRASSVTVNIQTPDADSFRRSQTQIAAALARAVARGRRGV